ncbi:hypothetical protein ACMFMG_011852 [Clarireedia jacksonii]
MANDTWSWGWYRAGYDEVDDQKRERKAEYCERLTGGIHQSVVVVTLPPRTFLNFILEKSANAYSHMQGYKCSTEAFLNAARIWARISLDPKDELLTRINTCFDFFDLRLLNLEPDPTTQSDDYAGIQYKLSSVHFATMSEIRLIVPMEISTYCRKSFLCPANSIA